MPEPTLFTEILERSRLGDRQAFEQLVEMFGRRLIIYCSSYFGPKADASAFAQETWLAVWGNIIKFDGTTAGQFWNWITTIARRQGITVLRKKSSKMQSLSTDYDPAQTRDDVLYDEEYILALRDCFNAAGKFRAALQLHFLEQMDYGAISEKLGISTGTVGSQISRGKQAVKKCIEGKIQ